MLDKRPRTILATLISSIFFLSFLLVNAQQSRPQFLISWRANSYVPNWYTGKIMPTKGTPVTVSFELVDNGKIADLSNTKARWYINSKLFKNEDNSLGIKSINFSIPDYPGEETTIRISLPDYNGQILDQIISIPVQKPGVVIDGKLRDQSIQSGSHTFEAIPFFFNGARNLNDLSFNWMVNNQTANANLGLSWTLDLKLDPAIQTGLFISVQVTVQNIFDAMQLASNSIQARTKK